jgi:hypothetical protein
MNSLPDTDLSTGLVTDSGMLLPTRKFEDTLWAPLGRLRTAARTAGLHLLPGYPDEVSGGDRLPLGDADETTVRELAAILTTAGTTTGPPPGTPGLSGAAAWLGTCAQAAGIGLRLGTPTTAPGGREVLPLGDAGHSTLTRLAHVIEQHLAGLYQAEAALRRALETVGVTAEQLAAHAGAIDLGDFTIPEGVVLLRQLDPNGWIPDSDPDDQCAGEDLATRLTFAIQKITGGGFIDAAYTPYCRYCHGGPALLLGSLRPRHAQSLTAHITGAAA